VKTSLLLPYLAIAACAGANNLTLHRGLETDGKTFWAVEDTFIDSKAADKNFGRDFLLSGGTGKVILIRFGDLFPWVKESEVIDSAQLVLTQDIGAPAVLKAAYRMKVPWLEGGERRGDINGMFGGKPDPNNLPTGSTWTQRVRGDIPAAWSGGAGALGNAELISSAKSQEKDGKITISGLGATFERFRQVPDENYGIALVFDGVCDFVSSEYRESGPNLVLSTSPAKLSGPDVAVSMIEATPDGFRATVTNLGNSPAALSGRWSLNGEAILPPVSAQTLAIGDSKTFSITLSRTFAKTAAANQIVFAIESNDANKRNNSLTYFPSGRPIAAEPRWYNEVLLPQSRFSIAPEGSTVRFNKTGDAKFSPDSIIPKFPASRFSGAFGGDTRDESQFPKQLPMLYRPWSDQVFEQNFMPKTDLLSLTAVSYLNGGSYRPMPSTIALRCISPFEKPLQVGAMRAVYGEAKTTKIPVTGEGYAALPVKDLGVTATGPDLELTILTPFGEATTRVPSWQLYDAVARAGNGVPVLTIGFPLPGIKLDPTSNLAKDKLPSDGKGSFPAQLTSLTDDKLDTSFNWTKETKWLEVDLGRDRLFGAVDLLLTSIDAQELLLVARETGQALPDATLFGRVVDPAWHVKTWCEKEGAQTRLRIFGVPTKARYIRLIAKGDATFQIAELRVLAGQD